MHGNALIANDTNSWVLEAGPNRWSAAPVITGDGFRALADFICEPENGCDRLDVASWVMRHGFGRIPIIYVKIDIVNVFIEKVVDPWLRRLQLRFVIVTHNGDAPAPAAGHEALLDDPLLVAWFSQNPRMVHPKLIPIPIGFRNRYVVRRAFVHKVALPSHRCKVVNQMPGNANTHTYTQYQSIP